jgi:glucokinase
MTQPAVVIGIDFGGTKTAIAVCDPDGRRLAGAVLDSHGEHGAQASFDRAVQRAYAMLAGAAPGADVPAVGVSTFGIPFEDRVELAPAIPGWSQLALGRELRAAFPGARVTMATDVKAAGAAEARWGSLADCDPALYINLGTGLAAAIVTGGRVLTGRNGAAGEIGYSLRSRLDVGLPEDERLILEDVVSGAGLQRTASTPGRKVTAAEVLARAGAGDAQFTRLVSEFTDELAFHVANIAIAVDPARIAIGGGLTRSWDLLEPRLVQALRAAVPYPPELTLADFPDEAALLGAVALAVDAARAPGADGHQGTGLPAGWRRYSRGRLVSTGRLAESELL